MRSEQESTSDYLPTYEAITGSEFKVPAIIGRGSGQGFTLADFNVPLGWEESISTLRDQSWMTVEQELFENECDFLGMSPGEIEFDSETGLITGIIINEPFTAVMLGDDSYSLKNGSYVSEDDISSYAAAFVIQKHLGRFLNKINRINGDSRIYSYIDGNSEYYPVGLRIPDEIFEKDGNITTESYQIRFAMNASNIAGRFGLTLADIEFNSRGVLNYFTVAEGSACSYSLPQDGHSGEYYPHNVENVQQAFALQGIGSAYINDLLRKHGR